MTRTIGRLVLLSAAVSLLCIEGISQTVTRSWLRVRAEGLYGRTIELGDFRRGSTALLSGADAKNDGLWIALPSGADPSALRIDPAVNSTPSVDVVALPDSLSNAWAVVPLSLGAWGVSSLDGIASIHISRGQRGNLRASSIREVRERKSVCAPERIPPPAMQLPTRVADFEAGPIEPLGNRFGFFAGRGGTSTGVRVRDAESTRLSITVNLDVPGSFGGFWLQLAPSKWLDNPDAGVDARGLASIAIRGHGTPRGVVKISDVNASKRDESVVVGTLEGTTEADGSWLRVFSVPLSKLDLSRLRSLVIDLTPARGGRVDIDEIVFLGRDATAPPMFVREPSAKAAPSTPAGMWVWNTDEILTRDSEWRRKLFETIARWKVTEVYIQLPHADSDKSFGDWNDAPRSAAMADLIAELHGKRIEVHALDGAAWLALPEERSELVALARSVCDYNAAHEPPSRFDAVHLDVEPYLLPTFGGRRIAELTVSLEAGLTATKQAIGPIPLWLDIPFWYDSTDDTTIETGARAGCAKRDLLRELFRIADGIGVMSYRTRADGADGLTAIALDELALGREFKKPMRLGIETISLPVEEGWDVMFAGSAPEPGNAVAVIPPGENGYVLFAPSATAGELRWLRKNKYRVLAAVPSDSAPPSKITFYGRSGEDIRAVVDEALELARRSGTPADGVAYHELRTLP